MANVVFTLTATDEAGHQTTQQVSLTVNRDVPTARFYGDPGPGRLYVGASAPAAATLSALETSGGGKKLGVRVKFENTPSASEAAAINAELQTGRLPWWSYKPDGGYQGLAGSSTKQATVRSQIRSLMNALVTTAGPVFLTFNHEPENDGGGTDAQLIADWAKMQQIAVEERNASGATKVTVVANLQSFTFLGSGQGRDWQGWLAAAAVCDIVGVNRYRQENTSESDALAGPEFVGVLDRLDTVGKPMAFRELGIDRRLGTTVWANNWNAMINLVKTRNVVAISYFDSDPASEPDNTWVMDPASVTLYNGLRAQAWSVNWNAL